MQTAAKKKSKIVKLLAEQGPMLVPLMTLDNYARQNYTGDFQAVCLFVDISGFSTVTHALMQHGSEAAESMADIMLNLFTPLVDQVYTHGGFITTFAGDAFTALFPHSEDAYQHALAAAVGIQQHMSSHPVQNTPYGRFAFTAKLGLGDGEVRWGILQSSFAQIKAAYYYSGPAIEAAAGAEHHAQQGNLILTASVAQALQDLARTLPAGEDGHMRFLALSGGLPEPHPIPEQEIPDQSPFLPAAILERENRGEFRQVVSVFINLMGIETADQLRLFVNSVFDLQARYGGYLNRVDFGDKGCNLLMFWGMPVGTENDLERALNFILELPNITPGSFRAGITQRTMYAGLAGSAHRAEFTCYGDGVNLAARLMTSAPWGDVWLDEHTLRRMGPRFAAEARGEYRFKGFDDPMQVFALLERSHNTIELTHLFQNKMVGRETEMAHLSEFIRPIFTQPAASPGALVVLGNAGIGKSRLLSEFLYSLIQGQDLPEGAARPSIFLCQTDQTVRQPFNPFQHWLRGYFDQIPTQSEVRNKRAFSRKLDELISTTQNASLTSELNRLRSCLGALIDLHWDNSLYAELDAQARYDTTLIALRALIQAECARQPVIIYLEDIHWLDEDSQKFILSLLRSGANLPFALMAASRPENKSDLLGKDIPYQTLELSNLSADHLAAIATEFLNGPVSEQIHNMLQRRAEGNPFIAEQILLYLREQNILVQRKNLWTLSAQTASLLPGDVQAIFTARLDQLEEGVKDLVQTAAILGRDFELEILARMLPQESSLEAKLAAAEKEGIWTALNLSRYMFSQSLLRDAAYDMQLRARRRDLHWSAAKAIESQTPLTGSHLDALAYHYEAAYRQGLEEARRPAIESLTQAGRSAAQSYQNISAVDHYTRALFILDPEQDSERLGLLLDREEVYHLLGDRLSQQQDLAALHEIAERLREPQARAAIALRKTRYAEATGNLDETAGAAQQGQLMAQAAQDLVAEARACYYWGVALNRQGKYQEASQVLDQALALARAVDAKSTEADILRVVGNIFYFQKMYAEAQAAYQHSYDLCKELGNQRGVGLVLTNLAIIAHMTDQHLEAQNRFSEALEIARTIGDRRSEGSSLTNLATALDKLGSFSQAAEYLQRALVIRREIGDRQGEGATLSNLGAVLSSLGQLEEARAALEEAARILTELGDRRTLGVACNNLAELHRLQGRSDLAQSRYEQALQLRRELKQTQRVVEDQAGLAQVALALGDSAQARALIAEILPVIDSDPALSSAVNPMRTLLSCYQILKKLEDPQAAPLLENTYHILQESAEKITDPDLRGSFLMNNPSHREIIATYTAAAPADVAASTPIAPVVEPQNIAAQSAAPAPSAVEPQNIAALPSPAAAPADHAPQSAPPPPAADHAALPSPTAPATVEAENAAAPPSPPEKYKKKSKKRKKKQRGQVVVVNFYYIFNNRFIAREDVDLDHDGDTDEDEDDEDEKPAAA